MNRVLLAGTRIYLRTQGARFKEVSVLTLPDGTEQEIVIFSSKKPILIGQHTIFHSIVVHEWVFRSNSLAQYVLVHETTHKQQWYGYLIYPIGVVCPLLALGSFVLTLAAFVSSVTYRDPGLLLAFLLGLFATVVLIAVPVSFSWLLEFQADCRAIRTLGLSTVLEAKEDSREIFQPTPYSLIVGRVTRPPLSLTFRICRMFHRDLA